MERIDLVPRRRAIFTGAGLLLGVSGCLGDSDDDDSDDGSHGDDSTDHHDHSHADDTDDHDHDDHGAIAEVDIIDRAEDEVVATYHGHWHGEIPPVPTDTHLSLGAIYLDENEQKVPIGEGETYEMGIEETETDEPMLDVTLHGDHVHLTAEAAGETEIVVQLLHDGDIEWETSETIGVDVG